MWEDFGLQLAMNRRLSNMGPISVVMREAANVRQALESLCRYMRLINATLLTGIEDYEDAVLIRERILLQPAEPPVRQSIEMAVGVLYRTIEELLGPTWRPRSVCFEHRPPRNATCHKTLFGVTVEFNASFNGIVCAARDLCFNRIPGHDYRMASYVRRFLDQALSDSVESATHTVRHVVAAMLPSGRCTSDQVAKHLGVDRRTLHRRLSAEGVSFFSLLQSLRAELASRQILDGDRSLAELADLLGFSSASAFAFWFRKHFAMTVSNWKQRSLAEEESASSNRSRSAARRN